MQEEVTEFKPEAMIADYTCFMKLTRHGYFKKLTAASMRNAGELKIKEDDEIFIELEGENRSELLFFTDKCNVYKMKTYELADTKPSEYGHYLANVLEMEPDENVIFMINTVDYKGNLMIGFKNGKAALFPISVYETKQNRKKLVNGFFDGSEACAFVVLGENEVVDLVATSDISKAVVFESSLIPLKSTRTTQGVQLLVSKRGSQMTSIRRVEESGFTNPDYFRIRKVPAIGYFIKDELVENKQINLNLEGL